MPPRELDVLRRRINSVATTRRSCEVTELDASGSNEGKMLGPGLRLDLADQARILLETLRRDR